MASLASLAAVSLTSPIAVLTPSTSHLQSCQASRAGPSSKLAFSSGALQLQAGLERRAACRQVSAPLRQVKCDAASNGVPGAEPVTDAKSSASPTANYGIAPFFKVEAIIRPWRLQAVSEALVKVGIRGITVAEVRGFGSQIGRSERYGGSEFSDAQLVSKVRVEIVVIPDQVDLVIDTIIKASRTGEIGDGKIFILPVTDIVRIRTGDRGEAAERMVGGRKDMLLAAAAKTDDE